MKAIRNRLRVGNSHSRAGVLQVFDVPLQTPLHREWRERKGGEDTLADVSTFAWCSEPVQVGHIWNGVPVRGMLVALSAVTKAGTTKFCKDSSSMSCTVTRPKWKAVVFAERERCTAEKNTNETASVTIRERGEQNRSKPGGKKRKPEESGEETKSKRRYDSNLDCARSNSCQSAVDAAHVTEIDSNKDGDFDDSDVWNNLPPLNLGTTSTRNNLSGRDWPSLNEWELPNNVEMQRGSREKGFCWWNCTTPYCSTISVPLPRISDDGVRLLSAKTQHSQVILKGH